MSFKKITQETFDAVVKENIEEFDMSPEDALEDAIKQFETQGVSLGNIVKETNVGGSVNHSVVEVVKDLQAAVDNREFGEIEKDILLLKTVCDIDLPHRCLAGSNNAYNVLFNCCQTCFEAKQNDLLYLSLKALSSLCNGQPDLLDMRGTLFFSKLFEDSLGNRNHVLELISFIKKCCLMHEENRQGFVGQGLITLLMKVLNRYRHEDAILVKEVCAMLRTLTLDDDIRVPFGKAHEHAKLIVTETGALKTLLEISRDYSSNPQVLGELFQTLGNLSVRNEFCQEVMDMGGIEFVLKSFADNISNQDIVHQILCMLKALSGNDNVKTFIVKLGGFDLIILAMSKHMASAAICEMSCACIGSIVLRQDEHCNKYMEAGGAPVIVQAMKVHKNSSAVQKQACMAIRNLVARTRQFTEAFLELGVEPLIRLVFTKHDSCKDEAKAALRDLGCDVQLKELWKGDKGQISQ